MKHLHAFLLALLLAGAVVAATLAVLRTTSLGADAKKPSAVPDTRIAARNAKLDKIEAGLRRSLKKKPPPLPKLPKRKAAQVVHVVSSPPPVQPQPSAVAPATSQVVAPSSGAQSGGTGEQEGEPEDDHEGGER